MEFVYIFCIFIFITVLSTVFNLFIFNSQVGEREILVSGNTTTRNWMVSFYASIVYSVGLFLVYYLFDIGGAILLLIMSLLFLIRKKFKNNKQDYCDRM